MIRAISSFEKLKNKCNRCSHYTTEREQPTYDVAQFTTWLDHTKSLYGIAKALDFIHTRNLHPWCQLIMIHFWCLIRISHTASPNSLSMPTCLTDGHRSLNAAGWKVWVVHHHWKSLSFHYYVKLLRQGPCRTKSAISIGTALQTHHRATFPTGLWFIPVKYVINSGHDDVIKWKHFPRYWPLCREFTGRRGIHRTKASDMELWCFLWSAPE